MKVLVCGGRTYSNREHVFKVLDDIHAATPITRIVQGGAEGADGLARLWASRNEIPFITYDADWFSYGKAAGPRRNKKMLVEEKPDLVVAFPGGRGTADMLRKARAACVKTRAPKILDLSQTIKE